MCNRSTLGIVALVVVAVGSSCAMATNWQYPSGSAGSWNDPSAWSAGLPGPSDTAEIDNGGTATLAAGESAAALNLYVGNTASGNYTQMGGTAVFCNTSSGLRRVYVGAEKGSTGTITVGGGTFTTFGQLAVGNSGQGAFYQTDGTVTAFTVVLGFLDNGDGTYSLSGSQSKLIATDSIHIGRYGAGRFVQNGGDVSATYAIDFGLNGGADYKGGPASGTYELHSGTVTAKALALGFGGSGSFIQLGGTVNVVGYSSYLDYNGLTIGRSSGGQGSYELYDGSLNVERPCFVSLYGHGEFDQKGGTTDFKSDLLIGFYSHSYDYDYPYGRYSQTDGMNRVHGQLYVANGVYELAGGTNTVDKDLIINSDVAGTGVYTVTAGTLAVGGTVTIGEAGTLEVRGEAANISAAAYAQGTLGSLTSTIDATGLSTIQVAGSAQLAGQWVVVDDGAGVGTFNVLTAGGALTGTFTDVNLPGPDWTWGQDDHVLWVQHVPEPATMFLLAMGWPVMVRRRRQRGTIRVRVPFGSGTFSSP